MKFSLCAYYRKQVNEYHSYYELFSGPNLKPKYRSMALAAHSISLSHNDSIDNTCMRFTSEERFQKRRMVDFHVVVRFCSNSRKSRYSQFISSNRNSSGLGSKWSSLLSSRTDKASSKCGARASETAVTCTIHLLLVLLF